eukprot:4598429-Pyramimonas_sp.AAC.1
MSQFRFKKRCARITVPAVHEAVVVHCKRPKWSQRECSVDIPDLFNPRPQKYRPFPRECFFVPDSFSAPWPVICPRGSKSKRNAEIE